MHVREEDAYLGASDSNPQSPLHSLNSFLTHFAFLLSPQSKQFSLPPLEFVNNLGSGLARDTDSGTPHLPARAIDEGATKRG